MNKFKETNIELITIIVNCGKANKIVQYSKEQGITGDTVALGRGTIKNPVLDFFNLCDVRKEIIYMLAGGEKARQVLTRLNEKIDFQKPNSGIAFTTTVATTIGSRCYHCDGNIIEKDRVNNRHGEEQLDGKNQETHEKTFKGEEIMYYLITAIVDKGRAEDTIDAALDGGATGGTIVNGRGSGIHETQKVFSIDIEPEKEIVLIISDRDKAKAITESIKNKLQMDKAGNGMIYVQEVGEVYGIS